MSVKIITTADGSNSLLNISLNETYHSVHGAIQESRHVFIQNGLALLMKEDRQAISILEVGFGTGLNALLTMQYVKGHKQDFFYTAIEPYPLPEDIWTKLNYPASLNLVNEYRSLHLSDWHVDIPLISDFSILKLRTTLQDANLGFGNFDLVYYDAFAPSKQAELWEKPVLEKVVSGMKRDGLLVTYCAKGQLKRDLKDLGLCVETLPGPPGKKEMVRGRKV